MQFEDRVNQRLTRGAEGLRLMVSLGADAEMQLADLMAHAAVAPAPAAAKDEIDDLLFQ